MTISRAEEAMLDAQARCISREGDSCEGYDGVSCEKCPRLEAGLERRAERREDERIRMVGERCLGVGHRVIQLRESGLNYAIVAGERFKDEVEGRPDIFNVRDSIVLTIEEVEAIKLFLADVPTS